MNGWRNATRQEPCPVCQGPDWCSLSEDGAWAACRRQPEGGVERVDRNGAQYYVHQLRDDVERVRWEPPPVAPLAPPTERDRVYRALLASLGLSSEHRHALRDRGLSHEAVNAGAYRTLPMRGRAELARHLAGRFDPDLLVQVPGIQVREADGRRWLSVGGAAGLVVPVRDVHQRIVALKVRADRPLDSDNRYLYVSSTRTGGPSPGAPAHVPLGVEQSTMVRVTEGELKADVATELSGLPTISAPGVNAWRTVVPVLEALGAQSVLLAFDADWRTNPQVNAMVLAAAAELAQHYGGGVELWPTARGKGIDDVLVTGATTTLLPFSRRQELSCERLRQRDLERGIERSVALGR